MKNGDAACNGELQVTSSSPASSAPREGLDLRLLGSHRY
jgi:hypothetical protein